MAGRAWRALYLVPAATLILLAGVHFYPRIITSLSRPATPQEMQAIAVAALGQIHPPEPYDPRDQPFTKMFVTIDGRNPSPALLAQMSTAAILAQAGSGFVPDDPNKGFLAVVKPFTISPFGTATGTINLICGNLCGTGYAFVLRLKDGRWSVVSQELRWMA